MPHPSGPASPAPSAPADPPLAPLKRLTAITLALLAVFGLATRVTGATWIAAVAAVLLVVFLAVGQPLISRRERTLATAAILLGLLGLALLDDPFAVMWAGVQQSCFLASFMVLIGIMREPAKTSLAIDNLGRYLTRQPPSRRYGAIAIGAAVLAALANVGALALLAPLVQAGVSAAKDAGDTPEITAIKERRQYSATLRGFALVVMFSPTTVTQALLNDLFPGADPSMVLLSGFLLALTWLVIGWSEDQLEGRVIRRGLLRTGTLPQRRPPLPMPLTALRDLSLIVAALIASAVLITNTFHTEVVPALMMTTPFLTVIWLTTQNAGLPPRARAATVGLRIEGIVMRALPSSAPEAVTLASAGFIGTMLGALIPTDALAFTLGTGAAGHILIIAAMPVVVLLAAQIALTPIVVAVCLAASYQALGELPVSPLAMVLSLSVGWALSLTASQYTAAPLILSRLTRIHTFTLSWGWNWIYNLSVYVASVTFISALELALM
ncbi:hypothetical protein [Acuticoccus yangtzensis]|uniref:hypothetical protein n=1 Tax=Acuticoccus yangtzensis TaxID=1443441 RepID=UPI0009494E1E|nr:hypothetical protein [Acuticoccus yangtzensis]